VSLACHFPHFFFFPSFLPPLFLPSFPSFFKLSFLYYFPLFFFLYTSFLFWHFLTFHTGLKSIIFFKELTVVMLTSNAISTMFGAIIDDQKEG
jgi:hypothetical protein